MEHQEQYSQQKVLPVTDTRTVQSLTENKQEGTILVLDNKLQNNLTEDPPAVDEQENEGGNVSTRNNHVPSTLRQSSSHIQNRNSLGSNGPLHNNDHLPNHSPELDSFQNSFPQPQDQLGDIYDSGPRQTNKAPTSPVSNEHSFNVHHGPLIINHGHITMTSPGNGTSTNRNQDKADKDTTVPINPRTKVDQAATRGLRVQTTSNSPGNILRSPNPSPSTSTQCQIQNRSSPPSERRPGAEGLHTIASNHDSDDTTQPRKTSPNTSASAAPSQLVIAELDEPDGAQTLVSPQKMFRRLLRQKFRSGNPHSIHNDASVRTRTSKSWPAPSKSIRSFFGGSRLSKQSISPYRSETLISFPGKIPIFRGGRLENIVDAYMNADLDPSKGTNPKFHPLWDPHITHYRSSDGSLPPVFSVNVYDVGHFDTGGRFTLLFNLCLSKEENEKLLKFEFKKIRFVPLIGAGPNDPYPLRGSNLTILNYSQIKPDHSNKHVHNPRAYRRNFIIRKGLNAGAAIAVLGEMLHYSSYINFVQIAENILFDEYFSTQSIEWYRHARHDRQRLVENGELVLITDTYKAAGWGHLAYYSKKGADKDHSVSFFQEPSDGSYHWNYDLDGCESAEYRKEPSTSSEYPMDQCIGFRAYAIQCPVEAWNSICNLN